MSEMYLLGRPDAEGWVKNLYTDRPAADEALAAGNVWAAEHNKEPYTLYELVPVNERQYVIRDNQTGEQVSEPQTLDWACRLCSRMNAPVIGASYGVYDLTGKRVWAQKAAEV